MSPASPSTHPLSAAAFAIHDFRAEGAYVGDDDQRLQLAPIEPRCFEPMVEYEVVAGMLQRRQVWERAVVELEPADFTSTQARDLFVRLRRLGGQDYRVLRPTPGWVPADVRQGHDAIKKLIRAAAARDWVALGSTGEAA